MGRDNERDIIDDILGRDSVGEFGDAFDAGNGMPTYPPHTIVVDNGASQSIEDFNPHDILDVDEDPFLVALTDGDVTPYDLSQTPEGRDFGHMPELASQEDEFAGTGAADDFHQLQQAHEAAGVDEQGRPVDELVKLIRLQDMQSEGLSADAPWVRIGPKSSQNALLGGTAQVSAGQAAQQVVRWVGEDVEATAVTITFNGNLTTNASPAKVRAFARITWGVRDSTFTMDIDVGSGQQVNVNGSNVYVAVYLDATTVPASVAFQLTASLGFNTVDRSTIATKSSYIDGLGNGGTSAAQARPNFAANLQFERDDPTAQWVIQFQRIDGTVAYQRVVIANQNLTTPVALGGDVAQVVVQNNGSSPGNATIMWGINA